MSDRDSYYSTARLNSLNLAVSRVGIRWHGNMIALLGALIVMTGCTFLGVDATTWINFFSILILAATGVLMYWSFVEQRKSTFMQFYAIVERHHSQEITSLRRQVLTQLKSESDRAQETGKSLVEINPELHLQVSTLANYYEALGTFLKGGWTTFPREAREMMLEMLHNSVSRSWPLMNTYQSVIYPNRPGDWAGSYKWLYEQVQIYKKTKNLE